MRPLDPVVTTPAETVIVGPDGATTETVAELVAVAPAWFVTVLLMMRVPEFPDVSAADNVIVFVPVPEITVGETPALEPAKFQP